MPAPISASEQLLRNQQRIIVVGTCLSVATPAHHGPPDFICQGCDSFGADASIRSFGLAVDLLVSLRLGVGDGSRSDSEGGGQEPEEVAERPSQVPTEARCGCIVHKPERARTEQREQHGRRGAPRPGAKRVLVPADFNLMLHTLPVGLTNSSRSRAVRL